MNQLHVENLNSLPEWGSVEASESKDRSILEPVLIGAAVALTLFFGLSALKRFRQRSEVRSRTSDDESEAPSKYWSNHMPIDRVDEASMESFPASDAPAWSP